LLLKFVTLKNREVDYKGRCETPVGIAGRLRPRRSDSDEEAQLTPHGKRATWSCNQLTHSKIATMFKNSLFINEQILKRILKLIIYVNFNNF
jgi:hypothetical protein